jgi:ABC-2 type transport system permease protein
VIRRAFRAYPTLLRVGLAEAVAYRAEFVVWMLTTTMPLVMLALWTAVARDGMFGRFTSSDFVAYYLAALIVRTLTGSWVVWEMNQEIRMGTLSMRLLKPIHPFISYSAQHLAAVPLRALLALPVAVTMLIVTSGDHVVKDPILIVVLLFSIAGAWLLSFIIMTIMGSLGMFIDRSIAVFEVYLGLFSVMSGYLVPLELMPGWVQQIAMWLPFRYLLGFPIEVMIGMMDRAQAFKALAIQWGMIVFFYFIARAVWRAGLRRFEAFGA